MHEIQHVVAAGHDAALSDARADDDSDEDPDVADDGADRPRAVVMGELAGVAAHALPEHAGRATPLSHSGFEGAAGSFRGSAIFGGFGTSFRKRRSGSRRFLPADRPDSANASSPSAVSAAHADESIDVAAILRSFDEGANVESSDPSILYDDRIVPIARVASISRAELVAAAAGGPLRG
jgi:hypothetical protein